MAGFQYPKTSQKEGVQAVMFTRDNLCALHEGKGIGDRFKGKCMTDSTLADLFNVHEFEIGRARKTTSYWEQWEQHHNPKPIVETEPATEEAETVEAESAETEAKPAAEPATETEAKEVVEQPEKGKKAPKK